MPRRVWITRPAGLSAEASSPYARGERAEDIVADRVAARRLEREQRAGLRAEARRAAGPRKNAGSGSARERSPNASLRRLERALSRRKTLVARQRVQAQIDELKALIAEA